MTDGGAPERPDGGTATDGGAPQRPDAATVPTITEIGDEAAATVDCVDDAYTLYVGFVPEASGGACYTSRSRPATQSGLFIIAPGWSGEPTSFEITADAGEGAPRAYEVVDGERRALAGSVSARSDNRWIGRVRWDLDSARWPRGDIDFEACTNLRTNFLPFGCGE